MAEGSAKVPQISSVPSIPKDAPKKNIFSELFSGTKEAKPEQVKAIGAVTQQPSVHATAKTPAHNNPLSLTGTPPKKSKPGTLMLKVSLLVLILTGGFFFSQNSTKFTFLGQNPAIKNQVAKEQSENLQIELLVEKHLSAVMQLEEFSNFGDEYFYDLEQSRSSYVSENKKTEFKSSLVKLKPVLNQILANLQNILEPGLYMEVMNKVGEKIDAEIAALKANGGDEQAVLADVQDLESARKLLRNTDFKNKILSLNAEAPTDEDYQSLLTAYNEINRSVTALIAEIKSGRTMWSEYWKEVEAVTKKIDPLFGTDFTGNLAVNSLAFSGQDSSISISGSTDTEDTKNFTLISNLLDAYESSTYFKDAVQRSFSKNASTDEENGSSSYSSSFEIKMTLESKQ